MNKLSQELTFILYSIKKNIQGSLELRTSFAINFFGVLVNNISFILIWIFLINSTGEIGGWNSAMIIGMNAYVGLSFGLTLSFGNGIYEMHHLVSSGKFDQFLLCPKSLLMRIATSSINPGAVGDMLFGVICLVIYVILVGASLAQILISLALIFFTSLLFFSILLCIQSISFYFPDPESLVKSLFETFFTPTLFHGGAFQGVTRFLFTFIIPSLVVATLPVEAVMNPSFSKLALIAVISILWFLLSLFLFKRAVKNYESSNFMTFGS